MGWIVSHKGQPGIHKQEERGDMDHLGNIKGGNKERIRE